MFETVHESATRPLSVTVISWLLIVMAVVSVYSFATYWNDPLTHELMAKTPLPVNIQFALSVVGVVVFLASGAAMLNRQNWGRLVYVTWSGISILVNLATSPVKILVIPSFLITALFAALLFRPAANEYLSGSRRPVASLW
jgi:hypothetical protein